MDQPRPEPVVSGDRAGGAGTESTIVVQIATKTIVSTFALVVGVWLAFHLTSFLLVVVFAILLATAIEQPVTALQRRGLPRPLAILAIYAVLIGLIGIVVVVLIPLLRVEIAALRGELPGYAATLEQRLSGFGIGADPSLSLSPTSSELSGHLGTIAERLEAITVALGRALVLIFVTFVIAFFLAAEPAIGSRLIDRFAPHSWRPHLTQVAGAAQKKIGAWARGQALVALIFGTLMGVGLWMLGVPFAVSLGTIAAVLEVIPYVGGGITVVLATLMALTVGFPQVIGVIVLYVVLVNLESHVLAPLLFGRAVGLPPVAILLALFAGVELLGVVGALLAVPASVIIWAVLDEVWPTSSAKRSFAGVATPPGVPRYLN